MNSKLIVGQTGGQIDLSFVPTPPANPSAGFVTIYTDGVGLYAIDPNGINIIQGGLGPVGPTGATGQVGNGISYNTTSRYKIYDNTTDAQIWVVSSSTAFLGLSWTRTGTSLTLNSPSHGLSAGNAIILRNVNVDNVWTTINSVTPDTITVTVANSGSTSGSAGGYTKAFTATSVSAAGFELLAPNTGDVQLLSLLVATGARSGSNWTLTLPQSSTNGAGENTSILNSFFPIIRAALAASGSVVAASMTLSLSNPNQFTIANLSSSLNTLLRLDF